MLEPGTIPLTDTEQAALDKLEGPNAEVVSMTRRDPGETGPVLVTTAEGKTFELDA